ncbi:MAG: tellurium resistance protein TerC [Deltaproteobacteria bacterium]|nr:tellurium resistance protein TerC [Deltaproteobacteria bacterium]
MADIFSAENLVSLALLILLQAVLGFDNLLYISLESKRAPLEEQAKVRRLGIGLAVVLRIVLLFLLMSIIQVFQSPIFSLNFTGIVEGEFDLHSLIVLLGGVFILYTATKEIIHMLGVDDLEHEETAPKSVASIVFWIVLMNLVFSFDSILSAMALTKVFWVMATAILTGGVLMIWLSDHVATFLQKNRMYEVLGLFILFVVGIMLLTEGGHLAHLSLFGNQIHPMTKTTFYFVIGVLVLTDLVQSRYQKRLLKLRALEMAAKGRQSGAAG